LGSSTVEEKKTSVHLVRKSAFAGVHPRKQLLLLTIKAAIPLQGDSRCEQVSKNRWHCDIRLQSTSDTDEERMGWLRQAYDLCC
jgi:hypothetical protein